MSAVGLLVSLVLFYIRVLAQAEVPKTSDYRPPSTAREQFDYLFTVIIPVYNSDAYLEQTLTSVTMQTIGFEKNIQIIIVNDGSFDSSEDIILRYKKQYPDNIMYISQKNQGVSAARNAGIPYIRGKYVNFLDSDDYWEFDAYKILYDFFEAHYDEVDVIAGRVQYCDARTEFHVLDYKFTQTRVVNLETEYTYIQNYVSSAVFKTMAMYNMRFDTRLKMSEDSQFVNTILLKKCRIGCVREALHHYRKRFEHNSVLQNITKITHTTLTHSSFSTSIF